MFKENIVLLNFIFWSVVFFLIITILFSLYLSKREGNNLNFTFSIITGSLLYAPFLINDINAIHAGAIGIGMHYIQYITFQAIIYSRKNKENSSNENLDFIDKLGNKLAYFSIYLIIYVFIMGSLLYLGRDLTQTEDGFFDSSFNYLFFLPFIMHNLHFYSDMFIWRFSNKHIRENIGKYLFV